MNTHILIPIKDWEEIQNSEGYVSEDARNSDLITLVSQSKQISLDEKDIEERAKKYADNGNWEMGDDSNFINRKEAYKQALKDLL